MNRTRALLCPWLHLPDHHSPLSGGSFFLPVKLGVGDGGDFVAFLILSLSPQHSLDLLSGESITGEVLGRAEACRVWVTLLTLMVSGIRV